MEKFNCAISEPLQVFTKQFGMATCVSITNIKQVLFRLFGMTTCVALGGGGALSNSLYRGSLCKIRVGDPTAHWAFTLAEVLITLGVIGVVSALTMPALVSEHREKVIVTRLNVVYNQLQQATEKMVQDENGGLDNIWGEYPLQTFSELLPKHLKVSEVKRTKTKTCCNNRAGTILGVNYANGKMYVLPSGAEIFLYTGTKAGNTYSQCNMTTQYNGTLYSNGCGEMVVDVDGFNKGRNVIGYDAFKFALVRDGILPVGMPKEGAWTHQFNQCLNDGSWYPFGCTAWVIQNKNMDYLHCPDKLGWNKQSSCKQ